MQIVIVLLGESLINYRRFDVYAEITQFEIGFILFFPQVRAWHRKFVQRFRLRLDFAGGKS